MNIIKYSRVWFGFSALLVTASAIALLTFGLPLGIDFTGGTLMELTFEDTQINNQAVQQKLINANLDIGEPSVLATGNEGSFIIKIKNISEDVHNELKFFLKKELGEFTETRFTTIGPTVGATLKDRASVAITLAIIGIILFVAYSFRKIPRRLSSWKFGAIAIVALCHDVFITVGIFAVLSKYMGFEVNILFITALLTILGYSVNDTIVIFDRIRENLKKWRKDETFGDVANKSLVESIPRSINTSLSTLFTLSALYFLGGESIQFFVLVLIIGTVIGTYSSIFLASPLLVAWQKRKFA